MAAGKFASLHPGLLVRKGEARPTMPLPDASPQFTDDPISLTPVGGQPTRIASQEPQSLGKAVGNDRPASVRISAHHKRMLQLVKVVCNRPATHIVDEAIAQYLSVLAENEMKKCSCFQRTLSETIAK